MFYVYILKSLKNGRFYICSTNNLERRFYEHNNGQSKYTRLTIPFSLIYSENFQTRKEAVQKEIYLKSGRGREWIKSQFE